MRTAFMNAALLGLAEERCGAVEERATTAKTVSVDGWNPENFARQQIHRLVRQVFCEGASL